MIIRHWLSFLLCLAALSTNAQEDLFGPSAAAGTTRHGFILNGNGSFDIPAGSMAKRFGTSYRVGASVTYKTSSNWIFGIKYDFLLGNKIKEDSFMINIKDKYQSDLNGKAVQLLNINGERVGVSLFERGFLTGLQVGKIFNFKKSQPDNGIFVLTTVGFIQHKINIFNRNNDVAQITGDYKKGYDRLTNGLFVEQFAGYTFFSKNELLNFNIGLDVMVGFTQGRRDYLYDVMRTDAGNRTDILIGIKGGWMIPIFKKKSEDVSFE